MHLGVRGDGWMGALRLLPHLRLQRCIVALLLLLRGCMSHALMLAEADGQHGGGGQGRVEAGCSGC